MLHFHVITLFPNTIDAYVSESILKRAQESKHIAVHTYNPIEYTKKSKTGALPRRVDDKPFGGGPGMVMRAEPLIKILSKVIGRKKGVRIVHFSPSGVQFSNKEAISFANEVISKKTKHIVLICGRYEGIDSRIEEMFPGTRYSIGDYVLTGGELPALVMIDAISRHVPGVLGDSNSLEESRDASSVFYTRPESITFKGETYDVPKVLLSGNHKHIEEWRKSN